jgi:hypothetical protein
MNKTLLAAGHNVGNEFQQARIEKRTTSVANFNASFVRRLQKQRGRFFPELALK